MILRIYHLTLILLLGINQLTAADLQIDEAIPLKGTRPVPVFVRMADQLFSKAGDHEAFCRKNTSRTRTENRKEVLAALQSKSNQSREKVGKLVQALEKSGMLRNPQWFWIVNGFFCTARPDAIRKSSDLLHLPEPFLPATVQ